MGKYAIINEDNGMMLTTIGISKTGSFTEKYQIWTRNYAEALQLEQEEAEAVINFINDVIDWELAQQLYTKLLEP